MSCNHVEVVRWQRQDGEPADLWACSACERRFVSMDELLAVESKLGSVQQDADAFFAECGRLKAERDEARSRLEHCRLALEGIIRMGSDNYGIISEAAKAADFALNAPAHDHLVKSL